MRMPFQIDLTGKVVLITGVSSGIGLGTAHEFARAGACVAGCARKPESDDSVSAFLQAVEGEGCKALYVQADVTQEEELEKLVQEVIATFGRLDIVVSNAGMNVFEGAAECSESRWVSIVSLIIRSRSAWLSVRRLSSLSFPAAWQRAARKNPQQAPPVV